MLHSGKIPIYKLGEGDCHETAQTKKWTRGNSDDYCGVYHGSSCYDVACTSSASSVMTQNAGRVKDQEQSRILAVSLADELEKELTVTPSQQEKTQASGTILEFVNSKITSGSWPSGEEQTFSLDSSALNQTNELSVQATLSWEEGENGYTDASLYITVHCIYHNMPFFVTTIYNAYTAYAADDENQNEDVQDTLYWIRSERR